MDVIDIIEAMEDWPDWADSWGRVVFAPLGVESLWVDLNITPEKVADAGHMTAWYLSPADVLHAMVSLRSFRASLSA